MIYKIIIYSFSDIDNSGLVLAGLSLQSCLFWHERPESVKVDDGLELLVSLQAELSHTALTEVSGMAIVSDQSYELLMWVCASLQGGVFMPACAGLYPKSLTICSCWFSCGACHRPYLYHRDAFCACQLYRDRVKRVLSTSWSFSTLQPTRTILNREPVAYHFSSIMI